MNHATGAGIIGMGQILQRDRTGYLHSRKFLQEILKAHYRQCSMLMEFPRHSRTRNMFKAAPRQQLSQGAIPLTAWHKRHKFGQQSHFSNPSIVHSRLFFISLNRSGPSASKHTLSLNACLIVQIIKSQVFFEFCLRKIYPHRSRFSKMLRCHLTKLRSTNLQNACNCTLADVR